MRNVVAIAICLVGVTVFSGCTKPEEDKLTIANNDQLTQTAYADEETTGKGFTFTAKDNWTATVKEVKLQKSGSGVEWLKLLLNDKETYSGSAGTFTMVISLEPNSTGQTRTATIEIASSSDKITITVTQEGTMQPGGFVIEATNVIDAPNDMASVVAISYGLEGGTLQGITFASAKYENNGFKLTIPATIPNKFLLTYDDELWYGIFEKMPCSDKNVKFVYAPFLFGLNHNKEYVRQIYLMDEEQGIMAAYLYADRDFTAKGIVSYDNGGEVEYDCSFKKGWNIMYYTDNLVTTQKPANANLLKWICIDA